MKTASDPSLQSDPAIFARSAMREIGVGSRAPVVNRTHRVVRERARVIQERRSHIRSLMLPLAICCSLLILTCLAIWSLLDQYEVISPGAPDATNQFLVVLLWFVPASAAVLAAVWFRRSRGRTDTEAL